MAAAASTTASGQCGDDMTWILEGGTLTISGSGAMYNRDELQNMGQYWSVSDVETIVIEDGVTSIGNCAFMDCENLTSVTIADSVTALGLNTFALCDSLTSIDLPENLEALEYRVFYESGLTSIVIPDSVEYIAMEVFASCKNLSSVTIGSGVTSIGWGAFRFIAATSITIPASVTTMYDWVFGYSDLTEIIFEGDCPFVEPQSLFTNITATVYYPANNSTWTEDVMQQYDGVITWVSYKSEEVSLAKCNVSYINNTMNGLKVVWNKVSGATGYYIYRKNNDGTYSTTPTATVTGGSTTEWTDTSTLTGGKDYTYKVAAYYKSSDGTITVGSTGTTKTCKYLKWGVVESVTNVSSGLKVTWTKVAGANGYYIFRKSSSDSDYTQVATVSGSSVVSWTDTSSLASGKNYTYKVSAIFTNSKGQVTKGGALTTKTTKYLTPGKISSLTNTSTGITAKWSKVSGASGYYVYRKASSASSYTLVKTITSVGTVSYTDTAVKSKNGTTYTYYVIPYYKNSSGAVTKGAYSATKKTVRLTAVSISSLTNSSSKKMTVKWAKNSKATGYEIQYSTSSSFASSNKTVTVSSASTVSKVISSLTKGKTYYVRVRAYKTVSGTKYYSAWSTKKSVKISK